jgi:membrane protein implicated in regulation of membrane protease activity
MGMDWNTPTLWWLATGALVAAELATGTFYLLMLALGCVAGAVAAHAGLSGTTQIASAALLGLAATAAWHLRRSRQPRAQPAQSNRDVNLDIGSPVRVEQWQADGSARVQYRGSAWSARFAGKGTPSPGEHIIVAVHGSELRVAPAHP